MATRIIFHRVVQDVLELGSDDARAVSRVHFDLEAGGELYRDLHVDLEEPVGGTQQRDQIKLGTFQAPAKLDQQAFEEAVFAYYQSLISSAGYGKHLAKDKGFRTHGDALGLEQVVEL